MKNIFVQVFVLIVVFALMVSSQPVKMRVASYLEALSTDTKILIEKEKIQYLQKTSSPILYIRDVGFEIRNQGFALNRQRYSLKVVPSGFGETKAGNKLYAANLTFHENRKNLLVNKTLKDRYLTVLDYIENTIILDLHRDLLIVYDDKINVLKKNVGSANFLITDLIEAENSYTKLKFDNITKEQYLDRQKNNIQISLASNSFPGFDTTNLITISEIETIVSDSSLGLDTQNVYLKNHYLEYMVDLCQYDLQNAENRRYISYLEFAYDQDNFLNELEKKNDTKKNEYNFNRAYLLSIGFKFPFVKDRSDLQRRKLAILTASETYESLKLQLKEKQLKDIQDIRLLVSQHKFLQDRERDVNAQSSLSRYLKMTGTDPMMLLLIKENILKNAVKKEEVRFSILRNYIYIMDMAGKLSEKPLRNYLSSKTEHFNYETE